LEKEGETLKWGDVYRMFKKSSFPTEAKDQDEMKIFKKYWRSGIFRVTSHVVVFPCVDAISWIIKHVDLGSRCIHNAKGEPIASFDPRTWKNVITSTKERKIDNKILDEFQHTTKELCPKWYKPDKQFKHRPKGGYPTISLRRPYQYMVSMLCRLYGEPDASHFSLSYMPLIYYCADKGLSFNWDDILSTNLTVALTTVTEAHPGTFPSFHMSSYLLTLCVYPISTQGWDGNGIPQTQQSTYTAKCSGSTSIEHNIRRYVNISWLPYMNSYFAQCPHA
jgi:hypothetical protein